MRDSLKKKGIISALDMISDLNLTNDDIDNIFERFKSISDDPKIAEVVKKISELEQLKNEDDIKVIMKCLSEELSMDQLNAILRRIIHDERLVDYIQDLFLEKLI